MNFVNDIDLVPSFAGGKIDLVAQVADVIYPGVGCGVNLNQVEETPFTDGFADRTGIIGPLRRIGVETVDRLRQQTGGCRFARAAWPGEQVSMTNAPGGYGFAQGAGDMFLPDYIIKTSGSPFTVECLGHKASLALCQGGSNLDQGSNFCFPSLILTAVKVLEIGYKGSIYLVILFRYTKCNSRYILFIMHKWLLLHYKLPTDPSARRVYIWRKLKRIGAILVQDMLWVLPDTPATLEQFQWLTAEIQEIGGEAILWQAQMAPPIQDETLEQQFVAQVNELYQQILAGLEQVDPDLSALSRLYQQVRTRDYFQSPLGQQVREALLAAKGESA